MTSSIAVILAVEDRLSEFVLRRVLQYTERPFLVSACYGKQGAGYLRKRVSGFNRAAKGTALLILTDLDKCECAPALKQEWLQAPENHNLLFRVAVREIESWIMADRQGLARFLVVSRTLLPREVETLPDPKRTLIDLAGHSRNRSIREDIVPPSGSTAKVGPDYNGRLGAFVMRQWDVAAARKACDSLNRALRALENFRPRYE